jgi:hypothetical protein
MLIEFTDDAGNKCTINFDHVIYFEKSRGHGTSIICTGDIKINVREDYDAIKSFIDELRGQ